MTTISGAQSPIRSRPLLILLATLAVYAATIFVRRGILDASPQATVWLSGVIVVGLLLLTGRWRIACFLACIVVNALGNLAFGLSTRTFLTFPLAAIMTWAVLRFVGRGLNFADPKRLAPFLAFGVVAPCAVFAAVQMVIPFNGRAASAQGAHPDSLAIDPGAAEPLQGVRAPYPGDAGRPGPDRRLRHLPAVA